MRSSSKEKDKQTPKEFAQDHWKEILAVSGTLAGAVILLFIRYHKKQKENDGNSQEDMHLTALEGEAMGQVDDTVMLLETGLAAKEHIPDSKKILEELEKGLPKKGKARRIMRVLKRIKS